VDVVVVEKTAAKPKSARYSVSGSRWFEKAFHVYVHEYVQPGWNHRIFSKGRDFRQKTCGIGRIARSPKG
jgi:hypothetical protein